MEVGHRILHCCRRESRARPDTNIRPLDQGEPRAASRARKPVRGFCFQVLCPWSPFSPDVMPQSDEVQRKAGQIILPPLARSPCELCKLLGASPDWQRHGPESDANAWPETEPIPMKFQAPSMASGALKRITLYTYQMTRPAMTTLETGFSHSETRSYWLSSR